MTPEIHLAVMTAEEIFYALLGGAIGALAKDCLVDGALCLPYKKDGKLYVGFVGGMLIGAFVGIVVDGSFGTALLSGYVGTSVIANLVDGRSFKTKTDEQETSTSSTTS